MYLQGFRFYAEFAGRGSLAGQLTTFCDLAC
jgi:hypothetical protein